MRWGVRLLAVIVALLLVLTLAGVLLVQQRLAAAGIDQVDWQGLGWADGVLHIEDLSARYKDENGAQLNVQARGMSIEPGWSGGPRLTLLQTEQLQLDWQPAPQVPTQRSAALPDLQSLANVLQWLPSRLFAIRQIEIGVPCGNDRCTLVGGLRVERAADNRFLVDLRLLAEEGRIELQGDLVSDATGLGADLDLQLSGQQAMQLQTRWDYGEPTPRSQGVLTVAQWPEADWLLTYLQPWFDGAPLPLTSLPTGLGGELRWYLAPIQTPSDFADMLSGAVELQANISLERDWQVDPLGALQGEVLIDLLGDAGLWQLRQGQGHLRLSEPTLPALAALPAQQRPQALEIALQAQPESELAWTRHLPLTVNAQIEGPVSAQVEGPLEVVSQPRWQAQWSALSARVEFAEYALPPVQLAHLKLEGTFAGGVDAEQLELTPAAGTVLTLGSLRVPEVVVASALRADLSGLDLQMPLADPAATRVSGPLTLSAGRLEQALLKPQEWTLNGTLQRDGQGLSWEGTVAASGGIGLDLGLDWPADGPWQADIELEPTFLRAGDPLSATLRSWPELLSLRSGRVMGQVSLGGTQGLERASGELEVENAAGIYDRASFEGLSARVHIDLAGDRLQLDMPALTLDALDPGIPMGPLRADLHYTAHMDRIAAGLLRVEQGQLEILGGQVALQPAALELESGRHTLVVDIRGLELDRLFEVYPAEGLRGGGTLDGRLPLTLVEGELVIDEGQLGAREPGGFLQYRSAKLEDLAKTTPGMRQVAQALDDFHYDLLNADVTYREGGILVLGLELQGRNPAVQEGRPIHLNIQLEEDIPALLASLQLSGKVSEVIQERIRQRLLQQRADP